jgi:hypothetical protein
MATLIDGRKVCTYCPDWRAECEARAVLKMPKEERRAYLYGGAAPGVAQKRGVKAADDLAALVRAVWEAGRQTGG